MAKKEKEEVKKQTPEETPQEPVEETPKEKTPEEPKQKEISPWEEKYNSEHDARLRLAAEYDNFRKRTTKEKEQSYGNGKADAVTKMLPIYDNLERALAAESADAALHEGVSMVHRQLSEALEKRGVTVIDCAGEKFDPRLEDAVMQADASEGEPGTVCLVLQKGYQLGDVVLRHAMVKVVAEA